MKKQNKTNAMRILETAGLNHEVIFYESDGFMDGISITNKLGLDPKSTFKTLVTVGKNGEHFVFVIPVAEELDLKAAAKAVNQKSVEMLHVKDINKITGYIRGGCSPIGMKKQFVTVIHQSAQDFSEITFSGGKLGAQLKMNPQDLATLIGATFGDIIHH